MPQPFPFYETRGGFRTATIVSGIIGGCGVNAAFGAVAAGSDTLFFSGQGRLNAVMGFAFSGGLTATTGNTVSGQQVLIYDAAPSTVVSGGPFVASGHRVIGILPPINFFQSGQTLIPQVFNFDTPFYSGLAAATRSGMPIMTITYTPEYNPLFAG